MIVILFLVVVSFSNCLQYTNETCFVFTRNITVLLPVNSSMETTEFFEVFLEIDTQGLVSNNKLDDNCFDLRFFHEDNVIQHYLETPCGLTSTGIWVKLRNAYFNDYASMSSVVSYWTTIRLYYFCPTLSETSEIDHSSLEYFIMSTSSTCEGSSEWSYDNTNQHLPSAGSTYSTIHGENLDHEHLVVGLSSDQGFSVSSTFDKDDDRDSAFGLEHNHLWVQETESGNAMPRYKEIPFCKSSSFSQIPPNSVLPFMDFSSVDTSKYEQFSDLNNFYPRGGSVFDNTPLGSDNHYHHFVGESFVSGTQGNQLLKMDRTDGVATEQNHVHPFTGDTQTNDNNPSHHFVIYGKTKLSVNRVGIDSNMFIFGSEIPPMGWNHYTAINGMFLRGSNSFGAGSTSNLIHSHGYSITLGQTSDTFACKAHSDANFVSRLHEHVTTGQESTFVDVKLPERRFLLLQKLESQSLYYSIKNEVRLREDYDIPDDTLADTTSDDSTQGTGDTTPSNITPTGPNVAAIITAIVVIGLVLLLIVVLGIVVVITIVIGSIVYKKRKAEQLESMLSAVVGTAEKESELMDKETELEEQRNEMNKVKLKDEEEKEKLKDMINKLKNEQENQRVSKRNIQNQLKDFPIAKMSQVKIEKEVKKEKNEKTKHVIVFNHGTWKGEKVIVRKFDPKLFRNSVVRIADWIHRECTSYQEINHPHIIKYKAMIKKPIVCVLTEHVHHPCGEAFIKSFKKRPELLKFSDKIRILYELSVALSHLHRTFRTSHGALSWKRVSLTEKEQKSKLEFAFKNVFTGDFESSKYSAPELCQKKKTLDQTYQGENDDDDEEEDDFEDSAEAKIDVFAYGIMIFELMTMDFDFGDSNGVPKNVGIKISNDPNFRPPISKHKEIPNWCINLCKVCWKHDVYQRPSFDKVMNVMNSVIF